MRKRIAIGFVLLSNSRDPQPSTRISVLHMLPFLKAAGYDPHILFEPETGNAEPDLAGLEDAVAEKGIAAVYFQKVHGAGVVAVARRLASRGVRTIYGVCDFVDNEMAEATDVTVVVTAFLRSLYREDLQQRILVIHDGIEHPELHKTSHREDRGSVRRPLRAVLVTSSDLNHLPEFESPTRFVEVIVVGRYPDEADRIARFNWARWTFWKLPSLSERVRFLRFLFHPRIRRVQWSQETAYELMMQSDIAIIPADRVLDPVPGSTISWWQVKSENRLTMKMSIGLPVIASPVPSYLPVIRNGENGYTASGSAEWRACFELLRDPRVRREVGEHARNTVAERFSLASQAAKLVAVFDRLLRVDR